MKTTEKSCWKSPVFHLWGGVCVCYYFYPTNTHVNPHHERAYQLGDNRFLTDIYVVRNKQCLFFLLFVCFVYPFSTQMLCVYRNLMITPFNTNMADICWQHQTLTACCFNWDQSWFLRSGKSFKAPCNIFYMSLRFTWQDAFYFSYLNHDVYG